MSKLKILHIIPRLVQGGAEKQLIDYVSDPNSHHEQHVLTLFENNEEILAHSIKPLLTTRPVRTHQGVVTDLFATRRLIKSLEPDAVVCWLYHAIALAPLIVPSNIPVMGYVHNTDLAKEAKLIERLAQKLGRLGSKRAQQHMLYCGAESRDLHRRMGYDDGRAYVIPNGISLLRFNNDPARRKAHRAALNIPGDALVFGCFGRFNPQKNWPLVFRALNAAYKKNTNIRLVAAGSNVTKDNVAFRSLIPPHLDDHVIALGNQADMTPWYDTIDILLMASSYGESFPLVLLESLAMGKPAIATSLGSIPAIVDGLFDPVPVDDEQSFVRTTEAAASGIWPGLKTPAKQLRDRVLSQYSLTAYTQQLDELLESICRG